MVGIATLISRITGLARDMVYAQMILGASAFMDALLVAFKIPNFLRRLFAEGVVLAVLRARHQRVQGQARRTTRCASWSTASPAPSALVLFVVTLVGVIAAPLIILAFAPGWHADAGQVSTSRSTMLRWTFPYLFFISLTRAVLGGVLNSYGRFARAGVSRRSS